MDGLHRKWMPFASLDLQISSVVTSDHGNTSTGKAYQDNKSRCWSASVTRMGTLQQSLHRGNATTGITQWGTPLPITASFVADASQIRGLPSTGRRRTGAGTVICHCVRSLVLGWMGGETYHVWMSTVAVTKMYSHVLDACSTRIQLYQRISRSLCTQDVHQG